MRAQLTLTVAEGKRLIAEAIANLPDVQAALSEGKVLLKGGTTVSAVMEKLTGEKLRISGRISPRGTKGAVQREGEAHSVLLEHGLIRNIDGCFAETVQTLGPQDIAIIGANAIDADGRAAMMFGSPLGGVPGCALTGLMAQGCKILIACGLEKMIPTSIDRAIRAAGMHAMDWSVGMSVGLAPIAGRLITEAEAIRSLANVSCTVIGCGGIHGAEGALTLVVEGAEAEVEAIIKIVLSFKQAETSGQAASLAECSSGSAGCAVHHTCAWRTEKGDKLTWGKK